MALEVFYPQDILNALLAAEQATASALQASCEVDARYSQGYGDGYRAALTTLALAFGLLLREDEAQKVRGFPHNLLRADWRG